MCEILIYISSHEDLPRYHWVQPQYTATDQLESGPKAKPITDIIYRYLAISLPCMLILKCSFTSSEKQGSDQAKDPFDLGANHAVMTNTLTA